MPEGPLTRAADLGRIEGLVLLDCRAGPDRGGYDLGHLAGARRVELETDLSAPGHPAAGGRHPLPPVDRWAATLGRWGIEEHTPVVAYDAAGGGLYAARCWWMLRAVGHERATVLDGSMAAAVAAGFPVESTEPAIAASGPYPATGWVWPTAQAAAVDRARADPGWRVIDARSAPRWRGEVEPIDPEPGRIEGSANLPWERTVGPEGRLVAPEQLAGLLDQVAPGLASERVVVHCGSGVTACQLILAQVVAGRQPSPLYVGSYSEWLAQGRQVGRG